ncbi:hypothetical protein G7Y89_g407 [Cudoniella acicularis]|uniref:Ankyrin n=1 Tax=Cudoniella acicularis TaxID=354080 RepID=A0A8H4RX90_9HELO|nr:hypothetical protein G7Y89_g407 [Cudoniella acicularis]
MAPTKAGGRPKIPWTDSRKRKLVRLYLLTDLTIDDIRTRNIQTQLKDLLPNNAKEWQNYRPSSPEQMKLRLAQLKACKENQFAKYSRYRARCISRQQRCSPLSISTEVLSEGPGPYSDPLIHYRHVGLPGVPSHLSLPEMGTWYAHQSLKNQIQPYLSSDTYERRSSDKQVADDVRDSVEVGASYATDIKVTREINENEGGSRVSDIQDVELADIAEEGLPTTSPRGLKRPRSRLSSSSSVSVRSLSVRFSKKVSRSLGHVNSVLSMTNSWRSSFLYTSSIASNSSLNTANHPLSENELASWSELVNDSKLAPELPQYHRVPKEISLYDRPCCQFFHNDTVKRSLCMICGFSEDHQLARNSMSDEDDFIDGFLLDRFGNTPLHHAAAAGNTLRMVQLIKPSGFIPPRNSSGETYLHVFRLEGADRFSDLLEVLRAASATGFPFCEVDYNGTSVCANLEKMIQQWVIDVEDEREFSKILGRHALGCPEGLPDSSLLRALKGWSSKPLSRPQLEALVLTSDIHRRDTRGYTPLAITTRHGLREITALLLQRGANPNTRSRIGTSILQHAAIYLSRAHRQRNTQLYAQILSCMMLLTKCGAKCSVTVFDEFTVLIPRQVYKEGETLNFRSTLPEGEVWRTPIAPKPPPTKPQDFPPFRARATEHSSPFMFYLLAENDPIELESPILFHRKLPRNSSLEPPNTSSQVSRSAYPRTKAASLALLQDDDGSQREDSKLINLDPDHSSSSPTQSDHFTSQRPQKLLANNKRSSNSGEFSAASRSTIVETGKVGVVDKSSGLRGLESSNHHDFAHNWVSETSFGPPGENYKQTPSCTDHELGFPESQLQGNRSFEFSSPAFPLVECVSTEERVDQCRNRSSPEPVVEKKALHDGRAVSLASRVGSEAPQVHLKEMQVTNQLFRYGDVQKYNPNELPFLGWVMYQRGYPTTAMTEEEGPEALRDSVGKSCVKEPREKKPREKTTCPATAVF